MAGVLLVRFNVWELGTDPVEVGEASELEVLDSPQDMAQNGVDPKCHCKECAVGTLVCRRRLRRFDWFLRAHRSQRC